MVDEQTRQAGMNLAVKAGESLEQAEASGNYRDFERAIKHYEKALSVWADNKEAKAGLVAAEIAYARCALGNNDFDLAQQQLKHRTPEAIKLDQRIFTARQQYTNQQMKKWGIPVVVLTLFLGVVVAIAAIVWDKPPPEKPDDDNARGFMPSSNPYIRRLRTKKKKTRRKNRGGKTSRKRSAEQKLLAEARKQYKAKKYDAAVDILNKVIAKNPKSLDAYNIRGGARALLHDLDAARDDFSKVIELNPKLSVGYDNRGFIFLQKRDYRSAVKDFETSLKLKPKNVMTCIRLGLAYRFLRKHSIAIEYYSKALKLKPGHSPAYLGRGLCRRDQGELPAALKDFDLAIAKDGKNITAYLERGLTRARMGDFAGADKDYDKAQKLAPKLHMVHRYRGLSLGLQGRFTDAVKEYDLALKLQPKDADTWLDRAIAGFAIKDQEVFQSSIKEIAALGIDTRKLEPVVRQRGMAGRIMLAGKALEGKTPGSAKDLVLRAQYRMLSHRLDDAVVDLEAALRLAPELGPKQIFQLLSQIADQQKKWDEKLKVLRCWAKAAPDSSMALNACAWELLTCKDEKLQDPAAALPFARKAVELTHSKNSAILDTFALALFKNGKKQEALKNQELAVRLLPPQVPEADRMEYEGRLEQYRKAVGESEPVKPGK